MTDSDNMCLWGESLNRANHGKPLNWILKKPDTENLEGASGEMHVICKRPQDREKQNMFREWKETIKAGAKELEGQWNKIQKGKSTEDLGDHNDATLSTFGMSELAVIVQTRYGD